ncbi:glycoside hydrolase family 24 protein [Acinetobacter radioresistens]|uniref:glycoside hydrolase family 24 protein n=1 Tax=Acinetobacter radioresistens TaxID=40216 RepID=UPI00157B9001|nr:glycoside hydrolase family 104 protein [Acinetobacter radioresistens]
MATRQQIEQAVQVPNVRKMLDLIATTEDVKHGYNTLFGNERINNLSQHPNIKKQFRQTDGKTNVTTAAGRYQFLNGTWNSLAKRYKLNDFSPRNQDLGAVALIAERGALNDVLNGNYQAAIQKLGKEWASLPSSPYAQNKHSWNDVNRILGNSQPAKATMNDLHQLMSSNQPRAMQANFTGRQLRPGFASDIPPHLRDTAPMPQARKTASGGKMGSVNDLHQLFRAQKQANYTPPDLSKEAQQKVYQEQLKKQGPTQFWESGLLGMADIGAPVVQGFSWLGDKVSAGVNAVAGTNLDTNSYERVTKGLKEANDAHNTVREGNKQGMDVVRLGTNIALTTPLAATGGTLKAGTALSSAAGREFLARNAALGGLIGATGIHENNAERVKSMVAGATGGAIGAGIGQKAGEGIAKLAQKAKSFDPRIQTQILASIDDKLDDALKSQGMRLGDLSDEVANGLRQDAQKALRSGKNLNPEAVARKAVLDRLGIKGTQAQITGDAKLWQKEAELAKISGAGDQLREKFISDNSQIANLLDEAIIKTGGNVTDQYGAIKNATDALLDQQSQNKAYIGAAYNAARNAPGNDVVINGAGLANDVFTKLDDAALMSSLPPDVAKKVTQIGQNPELFTLKKSEELIKILNDHYKSSLQMGQPTSATRALGIVRESIVDRQREAMSGLLNSGNDAAQAYQFARQAHQFNAQQIEKMPLIQDALKGVEPDKLFSKHILNGNVNELDQTVSTLRNINPQAVADIKQQVLQFISNKAVNQNGQFSPAGMKRALDSIGDRRLSTMFSPDELRHIKDIGRAGHYLVTQPPHSYVNNSNTSAALMNFLGGVINKPGVRMLLAPVKDVVDSRAVDKAMRSNLAGNAAQQPVTQAEQSIVDRLMRAGLLGGANLKDQQ